MRREAMTGLRFVLLRSAAIQSVGVAATFLIPVYIAHTGGADRQREFAIVKGTFDALSTAVALGLPAGLVYVINRSAVGTRAVLRAAPVFALATIPPAACGIWLVQRSGFSSADVLTGPASGAVAIAVAL